jgi:hypothetical protein
MARTDSPDTRTAPSVLGAHAHLIERLITNRPHHMPGWHLADALDFEDRAEHLRRLWIAVEDYTRAVLVDTAASSNVGLDIKNLTGIISDTQGDVVGCLLNAADEVRGYGRAA